MSIDLSLSILCMASDNHSVLREYQFCPPPSVKLSVDTATVISNSPVHSQRDSSKVNLKVKQLGESQLIV